MASVDRICDYFVVCGMDAPTPMVMDASGQPTELLSQAASFESRRRSYPTNRTARTVKDMGEEDDNAEAGDESFDLDSEAKSSSSLAEGRRGDERDVMEVGVVFHGVEALPEGWELLQDTRLTPGISFSRNVGAGSANICVRRRGPGDDQADLPAVAELCLVSRASPDSGAPPGGFRVILKSVGGRDADLTLTQGRRVYLCYRTQRQDYHNLYHEDAALLDACVHSEKDGPPSDAYETLALAINTRSVGQAHQLLSFLRKEPRGLCDYSYRAEVLDIFPGEEVEDAPLAREAIPMFAFPSGLKLQRAPLHSAPMATFFPFVLTGASGEKNYVACMTFYEPKPENTLAAVRRQLAASNMLPAAAAPLPQIAPGAQQRRPVRRESSRGSLEHVLFVPKCICLSSRLPFLRSFRLWLGQLYTLSMSATHLPLERCIAHLVARLPMPEPGGGGVQLQLFPRMPAIDFRLPPNMGLPALEVPTKLLFECLDVGNVLVLLSQLLLEKRIVLLSRYSSLTTEVAEIFRALLFPLDWASVYVPRLTAPMLTALDFPGPFFLGVSDEAEPFGAEEGPSGPARRGLKQEVVKLAAEDVVLVDLDRNRIWCKGRRENAALSRPELPQRLCRTLREAWEAALRAGGVPAGAGPPEGADAGFDLAPTPVDVEDALGGGARLWTEASDRAVRSAALSFMANLLRGYDACLITPDEHWKVSGDQWFDGSAFLRRCDRGLRPFLAKFCATQVFNNFVQGRTTSSDTRYLFFDECIKSIAARGSSADGGAAAADASAGSERSDSARSTGSSMLLEKVEMRAKAGRALRPRSIQSFLRGSRGAEEKGLPRGASDSSQDSGARRRGSSGSQASSLSSGAGSGAGAGAGGAPPPLGVRPATLSRPDLGGLDAEATYHYLHNGHLQWPKLRAELFFDARGGAEDALALRRRRKRNAKLSRVLTRTEQELAADVADMAYYTPLSSELAGSALGVESAARGSHPHSDDPWYAAQRLSLQFYGAWFVCSAALVGETRDTQPIMHVERALGVLQLMQAMAVRPDEALYRAAIVLCGRSGLSNGVGLLLNDMRRNKVALNAITYGQYTQSVAKQDRVYEQELQNPMAALDPSLAILQHIGGIWREHGAALGKPFLQQLYDGADSESCPPPFSPFAPTSTVAVSSSFVPMVDNAERSGARDGDGDGDGNENGNGDGNGDGNGLRLGLGVGGGVAPAAAEPSPSPSPSPPPPRGSFERTRSLTSEFRIQQPHAEGAGFMDATALPVGEMRMRVAAMWSAMRCPHCAYVALDEEVMEEWIRPASQHPSAHSRLSETLEGNPAVQVMCKRCAKPYVPVLSVQIFGVGDAGQPVPWTAADADEAAAEGQQAAPAGQEGEEAEGAFADLGPHVGWVPRPGDVTGASPMTEDVASGTVVQVPYLSPHIIRHAVEHLVTTSGEAALERDALRRRDPELYWNLQWYCCRFRVPLPLPVAAAARNSWVTVAAWDRAAATAAAAACCRNARSFKEWVVYWDMLGNTQQDDLVAVRRALVDFYEAHNPAKLAKVDKIMKKYRGRYTEMFLQLLEKYRVSPADFTLPGGSGTPPEQPPPSTLLDSYHQRFRDNYKGSIGACGFQDFVRMLGREELGVHPAIKLYVRSRLLRRPRYHLSMYRTLLKVLAWSGGQQRTALVMLREAGNHYDRPRFEDEFERVCSFLNASERDEVDSMKDMPPTQLALICRSVFGHLF